MIPLRLLFIALLVVFACEDKEKDCAGVSGGTSYEDECGGCDANVNNDCVQDCNSDWGGTAVEDSCGTCDNDSSNDCVQDCADEWGGNTICGCTDSTVTNYDSTATFDDGSCEYDTNPPTVSIFAPVSGLTVSGIVPIIIVTQDNVGISKVEFFVNDSLQFTDTESPYAYDWNTTVFDDGFHTIVVRAYDTSGNTTISDPITSFVSNWLLQLNMAWSNFVDGGYDIALGYFNLAKNNVQYNNMDTLSLHSAYGDIYTGIGWCNLRLLHAETARDNFIISQGYELHSFGTSVGLMAAYLELGSNGIPIDTTQFNLAIEIGHWILSSSMPEEFENDTTINVNDVKFLMGKSYYSKGNYSNNTAEEAGALYWILQLDSFYAYLDENSPLTWNFYNNGEQDYDSFEEVILMIILLLESEYW